MRYIRIDEENTHNLGMGYTLWPFEDEDDLLIEFTTSFVYSDYDEAVEAAMKLLKDPESVLLKENYNKRNKKKLLKKLQSLKGYFIDESLVVFDKNWTVIDCPKDYIFPVGRVFKDGEDEEVEEEKETPKDISKMS